MLLKELLMGVVDVDKICYDIPLLRGWLVAGLPLICTEGRAPGYKSMGRSHIHDSRIIAIQSIQTSCSCALPINLDKIETQIS
jgi:hypothetical protein